MEDHVLLIPPSDADDEPSAPAMLTEIVAMSTIMLSIDGPGSKERLV